jgi:hypothetical protein
MTAMTQRPLITAKYEYEPDRIRGRRPDTWLVHVPAIGRSTQARALRSGWIDLLDAEAAVRDLVCLWNGWEREAFDVELVASTEGRPPW